MPTLLIAAMLAATPAEVDSFTSQQAAAAALADKAQTGTLLLNRGDCLAIKVYTDSPYTHVAAIVVENGRAFAYDSMNQVGVRRLPLEEYLQTQRPDVLHVFQPREPFSDERAAVFKEALEDEIGRPYAVMHHLTGERAEGLHCSEYVTDALMATRLIKAQRPSKVSPASLVEGLLDAELYSAARLIQVTEPEPVVAAGDSWCEQMWIDTKVCTSRCCIQLRRWLLCH